MIDFLIRKFRISNEVSSFYAIKLKLFLLWIITLIYTVYGGHLGSYFKKPMGQFKPFYPSFQPFYTSLTSSAWSSLVSIISNVGSCPIISGRTRLVCPRARPSQYGPGCFYLGLEYYFAFCVFFVFSFSFSRLDRLRHHHCNPISSWSYFLQVG